MAVTQSGTQPIYYSWHYTDFKIANLTRVTPRGRYKLQPGSGRESKLCHKPNLKHCSCHTTTSLPKHTSNQIRANQFIKRRRKKQQVENNTHAVQLPHEAMVNVLTVKHPMWQTALFFWNCLPVCSCRFFQHLHSKDWHKHVHINWCRQYTHSERRQRAGHRMEHAESFTIL